MADERPLILLDVDGVLNKVIDRLDEDGFQDFHFGRTGNGFGLRYSAQMASRMAALDAEMVWLTTWEGAANQHIAPLLDWEPLKVLHRDLHDQKSSWWKSSAAEQFVREQGRPFIWLDDDLHAAEKMGEVAWLQDESLPAKLLISPDAMRGLLPLHLDQIEAWIRELAPQVSTFNEQ